jgi:hypothetical protein
MLRGDDNIKMDLKDMKWIDLVQHAVRWLSNTETVMNN